MIPDIEIINLIGLSAIYGKTQKVLAGVSFGVNQFDARYIECNKIRVPTNEYLYIDCRTQCTA